MWQCVVVFIDPVTLGVTCRPSDLKQQFLAHHSPPHTRTHTQPDAKPRTHTQPDATPTPTAMITRRNSSKRRKTDPPSNDSSDLSGASDAPRSETLAAPASPWAGMVFGQTRPAAEAATKAGRHVGADANTSDQGEDAADSDGTEPEIETAASPTGRWSGGSAGLAYLPSLLKVASQEALAADMLTGVSAHACAEPSPPSPNRIIMTKKPARTSNTPRTGNRQPLNGQVSVFRLQPLRSDPMDTPAWLA